MRMLSVRWIGAAPSTHRQDSSPVRKPSRRLQHPGAKLSEIAKWCHPKRIAGADPRPQRLLRWAGRCHRTDQTTRANFGTGSHLSGGDVYPLSLLVATGVRTVCSPPIAESCAAGVAARVSTEGSSRGGNIAGSCAGPDHVVFCVARGPARRRMRAASGTQVSLHCFIPATRSESHSISG